MRTLIDNATIVNEGTTRKGFIVIDGEYIEEVNYDGIHQPEATFDRAVDASGCFVMPGVIDDHVHFREPGMTDKADIESESRAAAAGGVTSYFDMPNTNPPTVTLEALEAKQGLARTKSHVNFAFFLGATNSNIDTLLSVDPHTVPGVKLFMGSSTGNMLVDRKEALEQIFSQVKLPIMTHCEDTDQIRRNMEEAQEARGDDPDIRLHPYIRSAKACFDSSSMAVALARKYGAHLHVAHVTTAEELTLFKPYDPRITAEAVIGHLYFCDKDYSTLGSKIKVNPAIKSWEDREALRRALNDGRIAIVGTDHAPHLLSQKQGGCAKAASGMPMIQFSLPTMLELVDEGALTIERLVELMCHNPARLFEVCRRGFLRKGWKADLTIVRPNTPWTVTPDIIESKCGWSPMEGHTYHWKVEATLCNGHFVYENGKVDRNYIGQPIEFR